jgi:hypothetical protein
MNTLEMPAATRRPEELVPSRYALNIGDIEVLVVSDGVLPLPAVTMATNAVPADLADWLGQMFLPPDQFDWPLNVMVARSGAQTVLIDAGLGAQFPAFPRAGQLPMRLEAAGIELAAVTDIVITHMHMDHVGGLLVQGVKESLASGRAHPRGCRRGCVLGGSRFLPCGHARGRAARAAFDRHAVPGRRTATSCSSSRNVARSRRASSRAAPVAIRRGTAWST